MKKTIFALGTLAIAGASIFTSCKKDNNNGGTPTPTIAGSWEARQEHVTSTINTNPPYTTTIDSNYAAGQGVYIEFRTNGTYISKNNASASSVSDSGSYSLISNNSKIVTTSGGTSDTANIALTATQFTTSASHTYSQSGISYTTNYSITFNKR